MNRRWMSIALLFGLTAFSCSNQPPEDYEGTHFEDPRAAEEFKEAMQAEDIPFDVIRYGGRDYFRWALAYSNEATKIWERVLGRPLRAGYSIGLELDKTEQLESLLREHDIPYSRLDRTGTVYITWDKSDDAAVLEQMDRISPAYRVLVLRHRPEEISR